VSETIPTVGIIGLGFGRAHIAAFQANGCRVVAVAQRDVTAARTVASRYGIEGVFGRWEDLIERAHPEIVVIATPPHLHLAVALRALAAGAHVLCEKPVAMTRAEGETMLTAAAKHARVAMTGFNWRFPAAMQELHRRLEAGAVGRVFHASARWYGGRMADPGVPGTWRADRAQAGHGAMGDMGVHMVDLVRWNLGEIVRVAAGAGVAYPERSAPGVPRPADAEDHCVVLAETASGALVTLMASRVARGANEQGFEVFGAEGALVYRSRRERPRWFEGELHATDGGGGLRPVTLTAVPDASVAPGDPMEVTGRALIAPLVARLLDGIRTGSTPSPSLEDGVRAQAVLDAVLEATSGRRWVAVAR
jgi:predicted dehydrogenase